MLAGGRLGPPGEVAVGVAEQAGTQGPITRLAFSIVIACLQGTIGGFTHVAPPFL